MEVTCKRCGAPVTGSVCEYCGVLTISLESPADEKKAVDEFHDILLTKDEDTQVNLLKNGFLPATGEGLIEAGVRCIPLLDLGQANDSVVRGAAGRLQAITTKLKLMPDFAAKAQAIAEFETLVQTHQKADAQLERSLTRFFWFLGLIFLLCSGAGVWMFVQ